MQKKSSLLLSGVLIIGGLTPIQARAAEWWVAPGGSGTGTRDAPLGRIQAALNAAAPADVIVVRPGTYRESIRSARHASAQARITLKAEVPRTVVVTASGTVLRVTHAHHSVVGVTFDGLYGPGDVVEVNGGGDFLLLSNVEVTRTSADCVDLAGPEGVTITDSRIHHCLNAARGRTDAHGVAATAVRNLVIRNTEIHTFSGDAFQVDPERSANGWQDVTLEGCRLWLAPLPRAENGFAAGTIPGENAVDTKAHPAAPRARLAIRNTVAYGFGRGLIGNMAAFNLKENVQVLLDRVTVFDSDIAFRLRGGTGGGPGAWVTLQNAVVHDVATAVRYEDNIKNLKIWNSTFGLNVARPFKEISSAGSVLDVRNLLLLGTFLPPEASHPSNMAVRPEAFVDPHRRNYHLAAGTTPIDRGSRIDGVDTDRDGIARPQGRTYDVGAYEHVASKTSTRGRRRNCDQRRLAPARGSGLKHRDRRKASSIVENCED